MPERFKPESPFAPTPEQAEEAKFWEQEIAAWMISEKRDKVPAKVRDEIRNNFAGWLPPTPVTGIPGAFRRENSDMASFKSTNPKRVELGVRLSADLDAYLDEHGLRERAREVSELVSKNNARLIELAAKMDMQGMRSFKPEQQEEIAQFFDALYYAMRKKGYTRDELAK